jgi:hypothetical protein
VASQHVTAHSSATGPTADASASSGLTWSDYRKVPTSPDGFDANTAWNDDYTFACKTPTVKDISLSRVGSQWKACVTLTLKSVTTTVTFDRAGSWVVDGKETNALLAHENLHFTIGQYIGQKAQQRIDSLPPLKKTGTAIACTPQGAVDAATKDANAKLKEALDSGWSAKWSGLDQAASNAYDAATDHGRNATAQADWEAHWKDYVDALLKW